MEKKLPTIKEIANRLNVSVSTVSRALSDNPRIGLRTRMRVQELAKELNYEPNPKAIFFKQKKTYIIGVVLPFIREEFFSQAISGIEEMALELDYTILFGQSHDDPERERQVVEAMKKQRVDGLLISLSKDTSSLDHISSLDKYDIPVVFFDRVPRMKEAHKVYCNLYKGTVEMINRLFANGYRRVAFINGPEKLAATRERLDGYIEGISRNKLKVDMQLVEPTDFSKESTYAAMEKLLSLKNPPTAIITFNDYVHMDAVQYAIQKKIRINKDIIFVSYANLPITGYTAFPPLLSIEQYPDQQGRKAMEMLMKLLDEKENDTGKNSVYYEEEIEVGLISNQNALL